MDFRLQAAMQEPIK